MRRNKIFSVGNRYRQSGAAVAHFSQLVFSFMNGVVGVFEKPVHSRTREKFLFFSYGFYKFAQNAFYRSFARDFAAFVCAKSVRNRNADKVVFYREVGIVLIMRSSAFIGYFCDVEIHVLPLWITFL